MSDRLFIVGGDASRYWSMYAKGYVPQLPDGTSAEPVASESALWQLLLATAGPTSLPADAVAQDALKGAQVDRVDAVQLRIAFNHENRIRALESKQAVTLAQFKTAVKALL